MQAHISQLFRFPTKGLAGKAEPTLTIDPLVGVVGDRQRAFAKKAGQPTAWAPKGQFYVSMNTPHLAPLAHSTPTADIPVTVGTEVHTHGAFNLTDTKGPTVTLLNLATVERLQEWANADIDPRRFRMNLWVSGLEPFAELAWVNRHPGNRRIHIGNQPFVVVDACERCKAIEANPSTGQRDILLLPMLENFMEDNLPTYRSPHRQVRTVMGVILQPETKGVLRTQDILRA